MNSRKANYPEKTFIDRVKLTVSGGQGGNGCISNFRSRIVKTGANDGGDGGQGGDVYVTTNKFIYDLSRFRRPTVIGNPGKNGHSEKCDG